MSEQRGLFGREGGWVLSDSLGESENGATRLNVGEAASDDWSRVTVTKGKTANLGQYEFGRYSYTISAKVRRADEDLAFDEFSKACDEMLEREKAELKARSREAKPIVISVECRDARVGVSYGVTTKAVLQFESYKADIELERAVESPTEKWMLDAMGWVENKLAAWMQQVRKRRGEMK